MQSPATGVAPAEQSLARAIDRHKKAPLALTTEPRGLGPYRGYGEVLAALGELGRGGAEITLIGKSVKDEPIFAALVGPADARRTSAIVSGVHPMEWIGFETHLTLLERLVERPPTDRRVISVLVANPDGVISVENNLRRTRRRFVRHNARGVDLNRNFPSFWGKTSLARLMLKPIFSAGDGPASEPEVRAIVSCFKGKMVDRALSLHSFGGAVLYPWGGQVRPALDRTELRRWARQVARRSDPHRPYRAVQSSHWVPGFTAPGMELDWFYDVHGALSLLVECSRGGLGLPGFSPGKWLEPFAWFNPTDPAKVAPHVAQAVERFVRGAARPSD
ncbi:MAG: hypothetical protein IPI67_18110 [Myxococcales bacterium]|nr:hypothetical protein [Myxococcales bacterium]